MMLSRLVRLRVARHLKGALLGIGERPVHPVHHEVIAFVFTENAVLHHGNIDDSTSRELWRGAFRLDQRSARPPVYLVSAKLYLLATGGAGVTLHPARRGDWL